MSKSKGVLVCIQNPISVPDLNQSSDLGWTLLSSTILTQWNPKTNIQLIINIFSFFIAHSTISYFLIHLIVIAKGGFKGNDSFASWMLAPLGCFSCVKNDNKNHPLDKLSQSFSDIFHNSFSWQKMAKSIVKDINEYLRNVFTI